VRHLRLPGTTSGGVFGRVSFAGYSGLQDFLCKEQAIQRSKGKTDSVGVQRCRRSI